MAPSINAPPLSSQTAQNPLTLRFRDPHLEQAYYRDQLAHAMGLIRGAYLLIVIVHV